MEAFVHQLIVEKRGRRAAKAFNDGKSPPMWLAMSFSVETFVSHTSSGGARVAIQSRVHWSLHHVVGVKIEEILNGSQSESAFHR